MPLTLYYLEASPPVRSVNLVIHALGLKAEHKKIDLFAQEHMSPEYLKLNPVHTVPTIDDDGFILWESRAIMTYLVSKYGKDDALYPKDLKKRAIVDQRLHFSNDVFYVLRMITKCVLFMGRKVTDEQVAKVKEVQDSVEKLLEGNTFIAGDKLTVADYSYVTVMDALEVWNTLAKLMQSVGTHPVYVMPKEFRPHEIYRTMKKRFQGRWEKIKKVKTYLDSTPLAFKVYAPTGSKFPLTKAWFERCKSTMKDFEKVNSKGAKDLATAIKEKL